MKSLVLTLLLMASTALAADAPKPTEKKPTRDEMLVQKGAHLQMIDIIAKEAEARIKQHQEQIKEIDAAVHSLDSKKP